MSLPVDYYRTNIFLLIAPFAQIVKKLFTGTTIFQLFLGLFYNKGVDFVKSQYQLFIPS